MYKDINDVRLVKFEVLEEEKSKILQMQTERTKRKKEKICIL